MKKLLFALGWLWALPDTLLGLLVFWLLGGDKLRWNNSLFYYVANPKGLYYKWAVKRDYIATTFGTCTIFVNDDWETKAQTQIHERTHSYQCMVLGVLFGPAYLLSSLWAKIRKLDPYFNNWFEMQAYHSQVLGRSLWLWE